jgi:trk system potassium uptake protein TrkA
MKAIVIGAGQVGVNIARTLSADGHHVTLVDVDPERTASIEGELDALVVTGNGASPKVLREIDAGDADLLAAVSEIDEVNIIAALAADKLGAETTIARVRDPDFFGADEAFSRDVLGIDFVIDPDRATADDIAEAILLPGAVSVEFFGDGRIGLAEVIVTEASPLVGIEVAKRDRPHPAYIAGYVRDGEPHLITPDTVPALGDRLLVFSSRDCLAVSVAHLAGHGRERRDCVIFGGGRVGLRLAHVLEATPVRATVLERDEKRARLLAEKLPRTTVLHDEGVSREAQRAAGVDEADAFVACAGEDRANLLAAMHAKRLGADLCLSVVSREEFLPLADAIAIDAAYSPRLIAAEAILRFVHSRSVRAIHFLRSGFEALELEAEPGSKIVGKGVGETHGMLAGVRIGAVLRGEKTLVPHRGLEVLAGDRMLMLGVERALTDAERAFNAPG